MRLLLAGFRCVLISGVLSSLTANGQSCRVDYTVVNSWPGGFQAGITIANTGAGAINGWTLRWTFGGNQQITNLWNGVEAQNAAGGARLHGGRQ